MKYELYHAAKGSQRANHKYIDRKWVNNKWQYIYDTKGKLQAIGKSFKQGSKLKNTLYNKKVADSNAAAIKKGSQKFKASLVAEKAQKSYNDYMSKNTVGGKIKSKVKDALGVTAKEKLNKKKAAYNAAVNAEKNLKNASSETQKGAKKNTLTTKVSYDAAQIDYNKTPLGKLDSAKDKAAKSIEKGKKKIQSILNRNKIKKKIQETHDSEVRARETAIANGKKRKEIQNAGDADRQAQRQAIARSKMQAESKKNSTLHKVAQTSESERAAREAAISTGKTNRANAQRAYEIKQKTAAVSEENRRNYEAAQKRARAAAKQRAAEREKKRKKIQAESDKNRWHYEKAQRFAQNARKYKNK